MKHNHDHLELSDLIKLGLRNRPDANNQALVREIGLARKESKTDSPALTLLSKGKMGLPYGKIIATAKALRLEPRDLFLATLKFKIESDARGGDPENTWDEISTILSGTHNEREGRLIDEFRNAERKYGVEIDTDKEFLSRFKSLIDEFYGV